MRTKSDLFCLGCDTDMCHAWPSVFCASFCLLVRAMLTAGEPNADYLDRTASTLRAVDVCGWFLSLPTVPGLNATCDGGPRGHLDLQSVRRVCSEDVASIKTGKAFACC